MQWFRNLKVAAKIMGLASVMLVFLVIIAGSGFITTNRLGSSLNSMFNNQLKPIESLSQARIDLQTSRSDIRSAILLNGATGQSAAIANVNHELADAKKQLSTYESTGLSPNAQQMDTQAQSQLQKYESTIQNVENDLTNGQATSATNTAETSLNSQATSLDKSLSQLSTINHNTANQAIASGKALRSTAEYILIGILVLAFLIGLGVSIAITRSIAGTLRKVMILIGKVAKGDLRETTDVDSKDEIGQMAQSVNDMIIQLREIMSGVVSAAENVSAASEQISAATEQIASGSNTQAQSSETMNQLFKELSTAVQEVAQNAEQASQLASQTMDVASKGSDIVRTSVAGMNKVNEQIARLSEDSHRVGEIVEVIDDIAEQTNLLALNAAIEAARAGEQGRGFAVVADEVRKLAERSGEATKQITTIIKTMQSNMEASVEAVGKGAESNKRSGEAFEEISSMVNTTADKVTEIAAASEEQSAQASEVLVSVESIAAAAEESAASSEETAASSQSLSQLAEELNELVAVFKIS